MSSEEYKKKYPTVFTKAYSEEYSFIIALKEDKSYIFCTICTCDFSIASGGKYVICKHISRQKHLDNAWILGTNTKVYFVDKQNDHDVIQRWISLSSCLERLVEQWYPLASFLKAEIHDSSSNSTSGLRDYKIPKLNQFYFTSSRSEVGKEKMFKPKDKTCSVERSSNTIASSASEVQKKKNIVPKEKTR
ncbi:hypothetical protein AVEN_212647-1 [Araneus ventricosus]|uniref:Uncharacterized protein n=1 Tax=Araneus ventricosus TaxID=182803 RepID=A0A4Y2M9J1_ARAVE|nr:hypothetical protein AVEN_212647-1 [Araneus ventricosus]